MVAKRMYSKRFGETPRTNSLDFNGVVEGVDCGIPIIQRCVGNIKLRVLV